MKTWWVRCYYTQQEGQSLAHFGPFLDEETALAYVAETMSEVERRLPVRKRAEVLPLIGMDVEAKHGFIYPPDKFWSMIVQPLLLKE